MTGSEEHGLNALVESGTIVMPGDLLATIDKAEAGQPPHVVRLGPGVYKRADGTLCASKPGYAQLQPARSKVWLENNQRRYVPAVGDMVIGIATYRHTDGYRVDIGASEHAQLNSLAFEGATKRNRPQLQVGALVYARVTCAGLDAELELSCTQIGSNKNWLTGETLFGELSGGGQLLQVSLAVARGLMREDSQLLHILGGALPRGFECVVGTNGRVWVRASRVADTIAIAGAIGMADRGALGNDAVAGALKLIQSRDIASHR